MNNSSTKQTTLQMSLIAGIIGVAALFVKYKMDYFVASVALIAAIVLILNLLFRGIGSLVHAPKAVSRICSVLLSVLTVFVSVCGSFGRSCVVRTDSE
ncbi:MAG: hypothetical protein FWF82_06155 [Oscillospiraceae bacterium]|nr:hypothetical protein [Oscillospiraceae bacterium]